MMATNQLVGSLDQFIDRWIQQNIIVPATALVSGFELSAHFENFNSLGKKIDISLTPGAQFAETILPRIVYRVSIKPELHAHTRTVELGLEIDVYYNSYHNYWFRSDGKKALQPNELFAHLNQFNIHCQEAIGLITTMITGCAETYSATGSVEIDGGDVQIALIELEKWVSNDLDCKNNDTVRTLCKGLRVGKSRAAQLTVAPIAGLQTVRPVEGAPMISAETVRLANTVSELCKYKCYVNRSLFSIEPIERDGTVYIVATRLE